MFDADYIIKLLKKSGKSEYISALYYFDACEKLLAMLGEIAEHYRDKLRPTLEGEVTTFQKKLEKLRKNSNFAYITYRIKEVESLIVKIITKYFDARNHRADPKYLYINSDNYYKLLTDLVGFRILTRFPQEWEEIDGYFRGGENRNECIVDDDPSKYITDWIEEFCDSRFSKPFLVEKPKWYYLAPDSAAPSFPINDKLSDIIVSRFVTIPSKQGYRSIHYLVNSGGIYIELQIRTLAVEAWSECEHETVYKSSLEDSREKDLLGIYSLLSANLTGINSIATEKMYEIANAKDTPLLLRDDLFSIMIALLSATGSFIERVKKYEQIQHDNRYLENYGSVSIQGNSLECSTVARMTKNKQDSLCAADFSSIIE